MNYKIDVTPKFERDVRKLSKKHKSLLADLLLFRELLKGDPTQGVALGKDCYKIRLAISSKGKGKRGGGRVITYVKVVQETVYLLAVYDKSERDTISEQELNDMLQEAGLGV